MNMAHTPHVRRIAAGLSTLALAAAGLLATTAAHAAPSQQGLQGWYLGGDFGTANYSGDGGDDDDTTFSVTLGYQLEPRVALEMSYRDLGSIAGTSISALQGSVVGSLPLQGPLGAYGRLGMTRIDADQAYWRLAFGFGAQYDFSQQLRLRAGYERYAKIEGVSTSLWTVGALFRF